MKENAVQKKLLPEVSIIRPIVISLLVLLHSFTKIAGGGRFTNDYTLCEGYRWFCHFISGFRIETIALIAGYVFAYQCIDLGRKYSFLPFLWKKFRRLVIPMLVFGIVYYFCFLFEADKFSAGGFVIGLLSGYGHLWFLPMLFWCFIGIWLVDHFRLSSWKLFVALALFSILPLPTLPFGLTRLPHFLFFVYAGYFLWQKKELVYGKLLNIESIVGLFLLYAILVVVFNTFIPELHNSMSMLEKASVSAMRNAVSLPMSCCGILALYLLVCRVTSKEGFVLKPFVVSAGNSCYGLYVFHQFLLVALYFMTPFTRLVNPYLVPWLGFILVYSASWLLTSLALKTKTGRFLIG